MQESGEILIDAEHVDRLAPDFTVRFSRSVNALLNMQWNYRLKILEVRRRKLTIAVALLQGDSKRISVLIKHNGDLVDCSAFQIPDEFRNIIRTAFCVPEKLVGDDEIPWCHFCRVPTEYKAMAEVCPKCGLIFGG